jgi:hypothetical protein
VENVVIFICHCGLDPQSTSLTPWILNKVQNDDEDKLQKKENAERYQPVKTTVYEQFESREEISSN